VKKVVFSLINASQLPDKVKIPDRCLISTFVFDYNSCFLDVILGYETISVVPTDDWILVTLNKVQFDRLVLSEGKIGNLFRSMTW
jgi:hypothetical protein